MKFWEDFFSTEKIIYPAIGAFIGGLVVIFLTAIINLAITDLLIIFFMIGGFFIGNIIKINKIQRLLEQQNEENKILNKAKKKTKK